MKQRLIKTAYAHYEKSDWSGKNESGWFATGDRIIILTDRAPIRIGSIDLPEETRTTHDEAAITGILIDAGGNAFTWNADRSRAWQGQKPQPGDRVLFIKYAGELLYGEDGKLYRVMEDRSIGAVMPAGTAAT
jgi:co-chaperonin GroES (HSP10)